MDRKMETRPPEVMERIVGWLVPPVCREYVLGDLSERYVSPRQYLLDALRTLPFVVASRVRRTSNPILSIIIGALLLMPGTALFWESPPENWLVAIVPAIVGSLLLTLRDAYRTPGVTSLRASAIDVAITASGVLLSQLSLASIFTGFAVSFDGVAAYAGVMTLIFFVRWQTAGFPVSAPSARSLSLQELTAEIRAFEGTIRRAVRIEIGACILLAPIFGFWAWSASEPIEKIGTALTVGGIVFVGWFLYRYGRPRSMPDDLEFGETVAAYRRHLEIGMRFSSTYFWWYILPLSLGPMTLTVGTSLRVVDSPLSIVAPVLLWVIFAGLLLLMQKDARSKLRRRMNQLALLEEKNAR
jgi:hypothetical protein